MAGATLTTLAELIVKLYAGPWVDALHKETFMLVRLGERGNVKTGRGNGIRWPVRYAGNTSASSYGEGDAGGGAGNQAAKEAFLAWKSNRVEISVSGQAFAVGAGGGMVVDPLRFELDNGLLDMRSNINTELMSDGTGNSNKDITGLRAAIADTGTYAGLDRSTYTWWKAYVNANGGTPRNLTEALMRDVKSTILETRGGRVTAIYTGSAQWYKYGDLLRGERRQQDPRTLTGGYQALDFEGIPLILVPGYPTGRMDFVDENLLEYHMLPVTSENAEIAGLRNVVAVPGVPGFGILVLGATKDAADFWVIHYSQLVCRNPYRMGSLQDLA
jgi:hypothetical protein